MIQMGNPPAPLSGVDTPKKLEIKEAATSSNVITDLLQSLAIKY